MKAQQPEDCGRLNPTRTVAIATALTVHVVAMLFLLAPARPAAQAQLEASVVTEIDLIFPPMAPPPEPPVPPVPPIQPRQPAQPVIQQLTTTKTTTATTPAPAPDIVSDVPDSEPLVPSGPSDDTFTDARADAQYGPSNRVPYPRIAMRKREQGEVQLRVLIGRNGQPLKVELARSSGSKDLDREAQRSVLKWRFVAAERNGEAVESWVLVPIRFNLNQA